MSLVNNLVGLLGKRPPPAGVIKAMTVLGNTNPDNRLPIVIPEVAVISGRTYQETKRSGYWGLQERLPEETVVAIVWLWGVEYMQKALDWLIAKTPGLKRFKNVPFNIGWPDFGVLRGVRQKLNTLELGYAQRYGRHYEQARTILGVKAARFAISVLVPLATVAVLIPWLNQKKTDWLLKWAYRKKLAKKRKQRQQQQQQQQVGIQFKKPFAAPLSHGRPLFRLLHPINLPQPLGLQGGYNASGAMSVPLPVTPAINNSGFYGQVLPATTGQLARPVVNSQFLPSQSLRSGALRFGGLGALAGKVFSVVGPWVDYTDWGRVLVIDTGIAGGRVVMGARRDIFEGMEYGVRDVISLYFYLLCLPHMMKLTHAVFKKGLNAPISLERTVADRIHSRVQAILQKHPNTTPPAFVKKQLEALLLGSSQSSSQVSVSQALSETLETTLRNQLRQTPLKEFNTLLQAELNGYFHTPKAQSLFQNLQTALELDPQAVKLNTNTLNRALKTLSLGQGPFSGLSAAERENLTTALLMAFRHNVGLSATDLKAILQQALGQQAFSQLSVQAHADVMSRFATLAQQDSLDQLNSAFRRGLVIAKPHLGEDASLLHQGELLSEWLEAASTRKKPLAELMQESAEALKTQLLNHKKAWYNWAHLFSPEEKTRIEQALEPLIKQQLPAAADWQALKQLLAAKNHKTLSALLQTGQLARLDCLINPHLLNSQLLNPQAEYLSSGAAQQILAYFKQLSAEVSGRLGPTHADSQLLKLYLERMSPLTQPEGQKVFSLALGDLLPDLPTDLLEKVNWLLRGGLVRDPELIQDGLFKTGTLALDFRGYTQPKKVAEMRQAMSDYAEGMLRFIERELSQQSGQIKSVSGLAKIIERFGAVCANGRLLGMGLGFLVAMFGQAILVPKLQYAFTERLTGKKQEHPGIEAAKRHIWGRRKKPTLKPSSPNLLPVSPFARSGATFSPVPSSPVPESLFDAFSMS